jgi:hypothetical protein
MRGPGDNMPFAVGKEIRWVVFRAEKFSLSASAAKFAATGG